MKRLGLCCVALTFSCSASATPTPYSDNVRDYGAAAKHATVLSDREEANVVLTDLFCMNRMDEPAVVFWRDASGRLARAKGWVKENCYPHGQKPSDGGNF